MRILAGTTRTGRGFRPGSVCRNARKSTLGGLKMLYAGSGEFSIFNEENTGLCFYRAHGGYYKDFFANGRCETSKSIEITKDEYIKKLKVFVDLVEQEVTKK